MKKALLAFLTLLMFATHAAAQSKLAIFGVIDTGIDYTNNAQNMEGTSPNQIRAGRSLTTVSGVMHGSRLGFRGKRELDHGLYGIFLLENGFEVNNGRRLQSDRMFGRQGYAGLGGGFGTITMGRHYDSVVDFTGPLAASNKWAGGIATHIGDIDNLNNSRRVNYAIKYTSINHNGLTFGSLYSIGGIPGHFSKNQIWSAGASYAREPLTLAIAYLNIRNPNLSFYEPNASGGGNNLGRATGLGIDTNPSYAGYASARTLQIIAAGGVYTFGQWYTGLLYSNIQFKNLNEPDSGPLKATNPNGYRGTAQFHNLEASLAYRFTPQLTGMVVYDYLKSNSLSGRFPTTQLAVKTGAKYHQFNLGLNYAFSKRTDMYFLAAYQQAHGIDSTGQHAVASVLGVKASNANRQKVMRIGLRTRF